MSSTLPSTPSIEVSTTQPVYEYPLKGFSERLIFRPLLESDYPTYYSMFSEKKPEDDSKKQSTSTESDIRDWFDHAQKEFKRVGIFLKNSDGSEGDLIGEGGVATYYQYDKWPEIFYQLKDELRNKGYITEFVKEFLKIWWNLPRKNEHIRVQPISVGLQDSSEVKELLGAEVEMTNIASIKVLEKAGFESCGRFSGNKDTYGYWRYISPY